MNDRQRRAIFVIHTCKVGSISQFRSQIAAHLESRLGRARADSGTSPDCRCVRRRPDAGCPESRRATVERAGALVAREQAAARQVRPELPAAFDIAEVYAAAPERLSASGHHGLVATEDGRAVTVMTAVVRENPHVGRYARLSADGFADDPDLADPTGVIGVVFGELAAPPIAGGVRRYALLHAALPRLAEALSNFGFGRHGAYGIQPAGPRRRSSAVAVRATGAGNLETVARLALAEIQYRSAPPMFAPRQDRPLADLAAQHRALRDNGAIHLLATLDGCDVGLLTVELTSPAPRLCPDGQP